MSEGTCPRYPSNMSRAEPAPLIASKVGKGRNRTVGLANKMNGCLPRSRWFIFAKL